MKCAQELFNSSEIVQHGIALTKREKAVQKLPKFITMKNG